MWMVVFAVVLEWYPELVQLWSISRNTAGHVQRPVSEVTGMTLLHTLWTTEVAAGNSPCYQTIVLNVTRGRPWWAGMVKEFIEFLSKHSGGADAYLWKRLQSFHVTSTLSRATSGKCRNICGGISHCRLDHVVFMASSWHHILARRSSWK